MSFNFFEIFANFISFWKHCRRDIKFPPHLLKFKVEKNGNRDGICFSWDYVFEGSEETRKSNMQIQGYPGKLFYDRHFFALLGLYAYIPPCERLLFQ